MLTDERYFGKNTVTPGTDTLKLGSQPLSKTVRLPVDILQTAILYCNPDKPLDFLKTVTNLNRVDSPLVPSITELETAITVGNLEIVQYLLPIISQMRFDPFGPPLDMHAKIMKRALVFGTDEIIIWLLDIHFPWSDDLTSYLLQYRNLKLIKSISEKLRYSFPLPGSTTIKACELGRLDILQWLSEPDSRHKVWWGYSLWQHAADKGFMHIVEWLKDNCKCTFNRTVYLTPIKSVTMSSEERINSMEKIYGWGVPFSKDSDGHSHLNLMSHARSSGHLDIVKWLHGKGHPIPLGFIDQISKSLDLEALEWVIITAKHKPIEALAYSLATMLEMVTTEVIKGPKNIVKGKWIHPVSKELVDVKSNDVELINWAYHTKLTPIHSSALALTIKRERFEAVKRLIEIGCPWNYATPKDLSLSEYAAKKLGNQHDIFKYLVKYEESVKNSVPNEIDRDANTDIVSEMF